jgi:hypothetical protein
MSAEGAEQIAWTNEVSARSGLKMLDVSLHALTDVATEYRPFGPKKCYFQSGTQSCSVSLGQYSFLVGQDSLLIGNYGIQFFLV